MSALKPSVGRDRESRDAAAENDSLHMLSLSMMPLKTEGLKKARLIKNSRLEGMVELFFDATMGSGQVNTNQLSKVFQFDSTNDSDLTIVKKLSNLSSYDIFSLRIQLRNLGIDVDEDRNLQLSPQRAQELNGYMMIFLKPLISKIYKGAMDVAGQFVDWRQILLDPPVHSAWSNLRQLAKSLQVEVEAIPQFLRDYGDVYLSLAFYQQCHDYNKIRLDDFLASLSAIQASAYLMSDSTLRQECEAVSTKLQDISAEVDGVLEVFKARNEDMWDDISDDSFRQMEQSIKDYQTKIGGALCALTVKMNAWVEAFPDQDSWSLSKRADFIMTDMRQGLKSIDSIRHEDMV